MESVLIRTQILRGLELCGVSNCSSFLVVSRSSRFNNLVWINDSEGEGKLYLPWMLINPNEIVSPAHLSCNTVCGPEQ